MSYLKFLGSAKYLQATVRLGDVVVLENRQPITAAE
jgi:hypothetical protein